MDSEQNQEHFTHEYDKVDRGLLPALASISYFADLHQHLPGLVSD